MPLDSLYLVYHPYRYLIWSNHHFIKNLCDAHIQELHFSEICIMLLLKHMHYVALTLENSLSLINNAVMKVGFPENV